MSSPRTGVAWQVLEAGPFVSYLEVIELARPGFTTKAREKGCRLTGEVKLTLLEKRWLTRTYRATVNIVEDR